MTVIYSNTKPDTVGDPSYHPDGSRIIFTELVGSTYKISTITLNTMPVHTVLVSGSSPYGDPYYSTDGTFVVFTQQISGVTGPHPYGVWSLNYMNADGSGVEVILNDGNANLHPTWVGATRVAFQYWNYGATPSTAFHIASIDLAGQNRIELGEGEYPRGVIL